MTYIFTQDMPPSRYKKGDDVPIEYLGEDEEQELNIACLLKMGVIEEKDERWKPKEDEEYWFVDLGESDGIYGHYYVESHFDENVIKHHNYFRTRKKAEQARDRVLEVLQEINNE